MKHLFILAGLLTTGMAIQATPLLSDNFDSYTPGNLAGQGGWTQTSTIATAPIQVSGSVALGPTGQDVYDAFSSAIPNANDGTSLYIGFNLDVTAAGSGDYFLHLGSTLGSNSGFFDKLFAKSTTGGYLLGVSDTASTGNYGSSVLSFGTTYQVVLGMTFNTGAKNDTFNIYVNSTDTTTPYTTFTWTSTTAEPASFAEINFRQGGGTLMAPTLTLDNLAVSTSYTEVVPEPSSLALIGAGAGVLVVINRRRK